MQLNGITKQELIEKFGHYFILISDSNRYGFMVKEILGKPNELFESDSNFKTAEEAFSNMLQLVEERAKEKVERYNHINSLWGTKWAMFKYRNGWMNPTISSRFSDFLQDHETAKMNLQEKPNFEYFVQWLPEQFYIPSVSFDFDSTYYYFKLSHSTYHPSRLVEVKLKEVNIDIRDNITIVQQASFVSLDGEKMDAGVSYQDFTKFNGDYFDTGYTDHFLFVDKEKCKAFAEVKIQNEINKLQDILKLLS